MSQKSSIDYAELQGLKIALSNAQYLKINEIVLDWLEKRIKELESK